MAKRSSYKKPLEWIYGRINTTTAVVTNSRIELGLKDDEVAEIHKIDAEISSGINLCAAAGDVVECDLMLSMDPDIVADPAVAANHDDLEVFFEHHLSMETCFNVNGGNGFIMDDHKVSNFDPPILVGTDVGMVAHGDAAEPGMFKTRLYFTRRKANVMELNQILLKRR